MNTLDRKAGREITGMLEAISPRGKYWVEPRGKTDKGPRQGLLGAREESDGLFDGDDVALLADETKAWIVHIQDISHLEAHQNVTLVHFAEDKLVIRRPLHDCERRLKTSLFFRANRGCIVNLGHVKQTRFLEDERLAFLLKNGNEVVFSRRQSVLFRKRHGL
jgi:DNA-binding LytR/AlgR family response regulator